MVISGEGSNEIFGDYLYFYKHLTRKNSMWRLAIKQKEQFRDGVGYSLIDALKAHASALVTDKMMQNARFIYPHNTPHIERSLSQQNHIRKTLPTSRYSNSLQIKLGLNGFIIISFMLISRQNSARLTVPQGQSIACSMTKEFRSFRKNCPRCSYICI
ncbi:hypothetical protein ZOSMA_23G00020 [Zostera marina]|uniref:Uncharacterized protein n=1 Tax=Zostera marina TaxID=29655 RepID=A0A0K9PH95_ZOSMR|nr:hypothetical protein ZOSMA_23G00020 [Zostera marina]